MNNPEEEEPTPALQIVGGNVLLLIVYLAVVFSQDLSDSTAMFLLFCHVFISVTFAITKKRAAWWVASCIVALPLISVLTR